MSSKKWIILITVVLAVAVLAVAAAFVLPKILTFEPSGESTSEASSLAVEVFVPSMGDRVKFTSTVLNVREGAVLVNVNGALCWVRTAVQSDVPVPTMR